MNRPDLELLFPTEGWGTLPGARLEWRKWLDVTLLYSPLPSWLDGGYFEWLAIKVAIFASDDAELAATIWKEIEQRFGRKVRYRQYLTSDHWQTVRLQKLQSVGFRCAECDRPYDLEVHHTTYERKGHELLDDLEVLCGECHRARTHDRAFYGAET